MVLTNDTNSLEAVGKSLRRMPEPSVQTLEPQTLEPFGHEVKSLVPLQCPGLEYDFYIRVVMSIVCTARVSVSRVTTVADCFLVDRQQVVVNKIRLY
jgi:hypothetical protein